MSDELTVAPVDLRLSDLVMAVRIKGVDEPYDPPTGIRAITRHSNGITLVYLRNHEAVRLVPTDSLVVERPPHGRVVT